MARRKPREVLLLLLSVHWYYYWYCTILHNYIISIASCSVILINITIMNKLMQACTKAPNPLLHREPCWLCRGVHCTVHFSILDCATLDCTTALYYTKLQYTALHCIAQHFTAPYHFIPCYTVHAAGPSKQRVNRHPYQDPSGGKDKAGLTYTAHHAMPCCTTLHQGVYATLYTIHYTMHT